MAVIYMFKLYKNDNLKGIVFWIVIMHLFLYLGCFRWCHAYMLSRGTDWSLASLVKYPTWNGL